MVESYARQKIHVAGTISDLAWGVEHQPFGDTLTFSLRKNAASTLAVTFGPSDTGWKTDSSSIAVSGGDWLDFQADVGTTGNSNYTGSFNCASARFTATTGSVQLLTASGPHTVPRKNSTVGPPVVERYAHLLGVLTFETHEPHAQFPALTAGTWEYLACQAETNSFNQSTTVISRINGGDGALTIVVPSLVAGNFEDVTHIDSVNTNDLLDYKFSTAADTGSLKVDWVGCHYFAATASNCMIGGMPAGAATIPFSSTNYSPLFGGGDIEINTLDTAFATGTFPYDATLKDYSCFILDGEGTCTLIVNSAVSTTPLAITASAGMTGWLTDSSHTVPVSAGDTCANQIAGSGVSGTTFTWNGAGLLVVAS